VGRRGVVGILEDFVQRDDTQLSHVDYGTALDTEEQRRRHVILSVLSSEGLHDDAYAASFKAQPMDDFPELVQLVEANLAQKSGQVLTLNHEGMAWSDAIGPWLYSASVRRACAEFDLK
jgi:oxygen-independent coproporphyrinogen-3 oxidase